MDLRIPPGCDQKLWMQTRRCFQQHPGSVPRSREAMGWDNLQRVQYNLQVSDAIPNSSIRGFWYPRGKGMETIPHGRQRMTAFLTVKQACLIPLKFTPCFASRQSKKIFKANKWFSQRDNFGIHKRNPHLLHRVSPQDAAKRLTSLPPFATP